MKFEIGKLNSEFALDMANIFTVYPQAIGFKKAFGFEWLLEMKPNGFFRWKNIPNNME